MSHLLSGMILGARQNKLPYYLRARAMQPDDLIGYWTFGEPIGSTTAIDLSGYANNATYAQCLLGQPGIGDGFTSVYFGGLSGSVNIFPIAGEFNLDEFTISAWVRDDSGADANSRTIMRLNVNGPNNNYFYKGTDALTIVNQYTSSGTSDISAYKITPPITNWFHVGTTVSKLGDANILYINGIQRSTTTTLGIGVGGTLVSNGAIIGTFQLGLNANVWKGWIAHPQVYKAALSPVKMFKLAIK